MPSNKPLPASVRYLKARLNILKRPTVWLSGSMLLLALSLLLEYWNHPQEFSAESPDRQSIELNSNEAAATVLTPLDPYSSVDEPAFGDAPSDTQTATDATAATQSLNGSIDALEDLNSLLLNPLFASTASRRPSTPASVDFVSPISTDRSTPSSHSFDLESLSLTTTVNSEQSETQPSVNPLQAAIDGNNLSNNLSTDVAQASEPTIPGLTQVQPVSDDRIEAVSASQPSPRSLPEPAPAIQPQPLPGQPTWLQTQPQPQFLPRTSPLPGTTGYVLPPALRTPNAVEAIESDRNQYSNNPAQPLPQPVLPRTAVPPSPSNTLEQPAPFSIPRAVPGRAIGGGEINTFSNP